MRPARSTATLEMLTVPAPIAVSVRTRLATANARVTHRARVPLSAPAATRDLVGLLDLPEDLRLAEDHRVEARRDAEHVLAPRRRRASRRGSSRGRRRCARRRARASSSRMARERRVDRRVRPPTAARARRPRRGCTSTGRGPRRARCRAARRASTAGSASAPPASFSRTSTGAVRCERPTTTIMPGPPGMLAVIRLRTR